MKKNDQEETILCALCQRKTPLCFVERHHLIPKAKGGTETEKVCIDCGDQIHKLFDINTLAKTYNSIESLKSSEEVQKWIKWVYNKKSEVFGICMIKKKKR